MSAVPYQRNSEEFDIELQENIKYNLSVIIVLIAQIRKNIPRR